MYTPSELTTKQVAKFLWRDKFYFKNPNITFHLSQESDLPYTSKRNYLSLESPKRRENKEYAFQDREKLGQFEKT